MGDEDDLTNSEKEELYKYLAATGTPVPDEKFNVHSFLNKVATSDDTTKVGNLSDTELGQPKYPSRSLKNLALISSDIIGNRYYKKFFDAQAEIITSTSLSKDGFLVKQATTTTRQVADITKKHKPNKGWFRSKEKPQEGESSEQ